LNIESIIGLTLGIIGAAASLWFLWEQLQARRRLSWRFVEKTAQRFAEEMGAREFSPTVIVGIGRGGAIMGALISGALGHRPLIIIDRKYTWQSGRRSDDMILHTTLPATLLERVLLVAGEVHSGNTMRLYHNYFLKLGAGSIDRATLFVQKGTTEPVEYVGITSERNLRLPWMFSKNYRRDSLSEEEARSLQSIHAKKRIQEKDCSHHCFIVRHGESSDNSSGNRFSGINDCGLTERGLWQARAVATALAGEGVDRIYSSPMRRAINTAREIQAKTGGVLLIDERLREMDFGEWEGVTPQDVFRKYRKDYLNWKKNPVNNPPPLAEDPRRVMERVHAFWLELLCEMEGQTLHSVVLVTHKTVGRLFLGFLAEQPMAKYRELSLANGSITKLLVERDGTTMIVSANSTGHLKHLT